MMQCAIIGRGWSAQRFIATVNVMQDITIAGVVTRQDSAPGSDLHFYGYEVIPKYEQVLNDPKIEAIIICTPPASHLELAMAAIQAGKNVIVEKPVGLHSEDIQKLHSVARTHGRIVMVPYHFRFNPLLQRIKQLVANGNLGSIVHFYHRMYILRSRQAAWLHDQETSGGVIYETLVHGFDLLCWFCGPPIKVSATGFKDSNSVISSASVTLFFSDGAIALVEGTWLANEHMPFGRTDVIGTSGTASFDRGLFGCRYYDVSAEWVENNKKERLHMRIEDENIGFRGLLSHFIDCCKTGTEPTSCNLADAYSASRIAECSLVALNQQAIITI